MAGMSAFRVVFVFFLNGGGKVDGARSPFGLLKDFFGHFPFFRRFPYALVRQMVAHHFRKRVEKDLERFAVVGKFVPVGIFFPVPRLLNGVLNEFGDFVRIGGLRKAEVLRFVFQVDGNVALSKQRVEYGITTDFNAVDGTEIHVRNVSGEDVPIEVHDSFVGNEPNVVIPIENGVEQIEVHRDEIPLEVRERNE